MPSNVSAYSTSHASPWRTRASRVSSRTRRERLDARERVERVAAEEAGRGLDRTAGPPVLVAPVLAHLRLARRLEVEVRGAPRRPGGAREHDAEQVLVLVLADQLAEGEQLRRRLRLVPAADVRRRARARGGERVDARADVAQLRAERLDVVARRLDAHEEAVERGELDAGRVEPRLERLDERRPRAGERIEHVAAGRQVPVEQHLDELRDELAVVRMEAVDVLRPHVLGQLALGPRELEVQRRVQLLLRDRHESGLRYSGSQPSSYGTCSMTRPAYASLRARRLDGYSGRRASARTGSAG